MAAARRGGGCIGRCGDVGMRCFIGFDPVVGLYAAILPLVAYAVFSTLRHLIINPDAATCGRRNFDAKGGAAEDMARDRGRTGMNRGCVKEFFGSVSYEKLLTLVNQRVADGRVLG
jgi:hypothetical protein